MGLLPPDGPAAKSCKHASCKSRYVVHAEPDPTSGDPGPLFFLLLSKQVRNSPRRAMQKQGVDKSSESMQAREDDDLRVKP